LAAENFLGNIVDFHYLFSVKFLFIVQFTLSYFPVHINAW